MLSRNMRSQFARCDPLSGSLVITETQSGNDPQHDDLDKLAEVLGKHVSMITDVIFFSYVFQAMGRPITTPDDVQHELAAMICELRSIAVWGTGDFESANAFCLACSKYLRTSPHAESHGPRHAYA